MTDAEIVEVVARIRRLKAGADWQDMADLIERQAARIAELEKRQSFPPPKGTIYGDPETIAALALQPEKNKQLLNLLRQTLPYLERHDDEGPLGYGWKSMEFEALIKQITKEMQHGS